MTRRIPPVALTASIGAAWGAIGYLVLWGYTPVFPSRRFVVGAFGTLVLLPIRLVLWGLRGLERALDRNFDLADSHAWLGLAAATVGAALVSVAFLAVRAFGRWRGRRAG